MTRFSKAWELSLARATLLVAMSAVTLLALALLCWPISERLGDVFRNEFAKKALVSDARRRLESLGLAEHPESGLAIDLFPEWTYPDISRADTASAEISSLADIVPGGVGIWLPSAASVDDAYGGLLLTLLEDEMPAGMAELAKHVESARNNLINHLKSSRSNSLGAVDIAKNDHSLMSLFARELGITAPGSDIFRELAADYASYDNREENGTATVTTLPAVDTWLGSSAPSSELVGAGRLTWLDPSQPGAASELSMDAQLWGKKEQILRIMRPSWFRSPYIRLGRERARTSNRYSIFFGPEGLLERIPIAFVASKEKDHTIVLDPSAGKRALAAAGQFSTIRFASPYRSLAAPTATLSHDASGRFWFTHSVENRVVLTAVISQRY